jgi:hypothetical protein
MSPCFDLDLQPGVAAVNTKFVGTAALLACAVARVVCAQVAPLSTESASAGEDDAEVAAGAPA